MALQMYSKNLRFKPENTIMAAVLRRRKFSITLKKSGYKINGLNDAEKAKIIYITHHLGLSDAKTFNKAYKIQKGKAKTIFSKNNYRGKSTFSKVKNGSI